MGRPLEEQRGSVSRALRPGSEVSDLMELVRGEDARVSGGGRLRTYLGTAPGVGKTFAMLAERRRRAGRGERVVAGLRPAASSAAWR